MTQEQFIEHLALALHAFYVMGTLDATDERIAAISSPKPTPTTKEEKDLEAVDDLFDGRRRF